jgi:hypothetical protein
MEPVVDELVVMELVDDAGRGMFPTNIETYWCVSCKHRPKSSVA